MQFLEANARRVVIKIGTNALTGPDGALLIDRIHDICSQVANLRRQDYDVIVISSGAIGMGLDSLEISRRPPDLASLQACAAIGQSRLMEAWQSAMAAHDMIAAQILLTREDVRGRKRHLAVRNTLEKLISFGAVPVVNENDTVSVDEIKFGDNDVLSALVASLMKADLLVILSTIDGFMKDMGKGDLIPIIEEITEEIRSMAGGALNDRSTGGMITKIEAAKLATQSGCGVFIGNASIPGILDKLQSGTARGTFFMPQTLSLAGRKRWIAFFEKPEGELHLDDGAVQAVVERNSSLLAKGVLSAKGNFKVGSVVTVHAPDKKVVARGIVAFDSASLNKILGKDSSEIRLQYPDRSRVEVIHRDGLVLI